MRGAVEHTLADQAVARRRHAIHFHTQHFGKVIRPVRPQRHKGERALGIGYGRAHLAEELRQTCPHQRDGNCNWFARCSALISAASSSSGT